MQRQQGLIPICEVIDGLDGPALALRLERPPQRHFTHADQGDKLAAAREADTHD